MPTDTTYDSFWSQVSNSTEGLPWHPLPEPEQQPTFFSPSVYYGGNVADQAKAYNNALRVHNYVTGRGTREWPLGRDWFQTGQQWPKEGDTVNYNGIDAKFVGWQEDQGDGWGRRPIIELPNGERTTYIPTRHIPDVEVTGHLKTAADDLDSVFADVLTGGIASTEKMASDQLKEGINNGNWKDIFSGTATALSPLMFASGPARPFATTLFGVDRLLVDPNGIQKTGRELLNGNYWNAAKSFAGDVFNGAVAGVGMYGMADDALNLAARLGSTDAKSIQLARALNKDIKGTELNTESSFSGLNPYEEFNYYHGGLEPDFDFNSIDLFRKGSKQAKKGKDYGGFYLSGSGTKQQAFGYGDGEAHGLKISDSAKTLKLDDNIERISTSKLKQYKNEGYDLVEGYNVFGEPETILLNKDVIEKSKYFYDSPTNEVNLNRVPRDILTSPKRTKEPTISWEDAVSPKYPEITAENAASITPEQWTAAQDAAIARGDMVEAQRLADLHSDMAAQKEGFSVYDTYHGQAFTDKTYKSKGYNPYSDSRNTSGFFSVPSIDVARTYNQESGAPVLALHTYLKSPYITDAKGSSWQQVPIYNLKGQVFRTTTTDKLANQAFRSGSDGVIVKNVDDIANGSDLSKELAITDDYISIPGRNKLRDAVTYDDNNLRVPLGKRHNFNIKDTRWGILGPIIGTVGYGLYNNFNSTNSDIHAYGGSLVQQANMFGGGGPKKTIIPGNLPPYFSYDKDKDEYISDYYSDEDDAPDFKWWRSRQAKELKQTHRQVVDTDGGKIKYVPIDVYEAGSWKARGLPNPLYDDLQGGGFYLNPFENEIITGDGKIAVMAEGEFDEFGNQLYETDDGELYTDGSGEFSQGGPLYKQWQDLSIKEKADMIKVGVKNGLTNMSDIRQKYNEFASGGNLYPNGGWRDIAKYHIRRNEGFRQHSYADAPKGKSWRSVGYGFNDSGFYSKYPMGISKYYDSRGGITKQEAEQELDYMLNIMENQARRAYGSRWDQFNDNQKAAIMDTMYQRPASVLKGSQFYKAVMAGDPNAGNYLGVTGYANRNNIRRGLFGNPQIAVPQEQQLQMQQPLIIPYESLNIQALNTPQTTQQPIIDPEAQRKQQELEERQQALAEKALAAENKQRGMENLAMAWRMLNEDTSSTDTSNSMPNMLTNNLYNLYSPMADGGNLYVAGGRKRNPVSIQTNSPKVDLSNSNYVYNAIPYLFAQDGLEIVMTSGFRPNSIVVGNGNKSRHSQINGAGDFRPKNGDYARMLQILNDPNSHVSRWMRMNGFGYLNEAPSIGGTTKHWPKKYFLADGRPGPHDHFHIGRDFAQQYANMFKNIPLQQEPQQMQPVFMPVMTDPVLASYQRPIQQPQPLVDEATQKALLEQQERETALAEKQQAALEKQHNMQMFANVYDLLYNSGNNDSNTPPINRDNIFRFAAYGGEIKTK